ncbi:MAG: hypothetical protein ACLRSW_10980 [Christensenellaceae bacterium]
MFIVRALGRRPAKQARIRQFQPFCPCGAKTAQRRKKRSIKSSPTGIRTIISAIGGGLDPDFKLDRSITIK